MYNTLAHRANIISSTPEDLNSKLDHPRKVLMACQFPNWALNRLHQQSIVKHNQNSNNNQAEDQPNNSNRDNNNNNRQSRNISIVIPYIPGLVEKLKRHATNKACRYISKGQTQSNNFSWHPWRRTLSYPKMGSSSNTSAQQQTAQRDT